MHHRRLITILSAAALILAPWNPASALSWPYSSDVCYMHTVEKHRVYCKMNYAISEPDSYTASNWVIFAPKAPQTDLQTDVASRMTAEGTIPATSIQELSPLRRPILEAQIDGLKCPHKFSATLEYWATINERRLSERQPTEPVPALPPSERERWLRQSTHYDFASPEFRQWLSANRLVKRADDSEMRFAWRVYDFVASEYSYKFDTGQNRCVSALCRAKTIDCGGGSFLFVSTMRANGIPARALVGRLVKSEAHPEVGDSNETVHVIAEFYDRRAGWVPVDVAGALGGDSGQVMRNFGQFEGNFLTMHIDPDLKVDSHWFGLQDIQVMQRPAFWTTGQGTLNTTVNVQWTAIMQPVTK